MPLAAVPEHGDLAAQEPDVALLDDLGHVVEFPFGSDLDGGGCGAAACARPPEADAAGADELADAIWANELFECLDLLGAADELERDRVAADVGNACTGHLAERDELGASVRGHGDGDQRELPLDRLVGAQLGDAEHVDELVHLLLDLLQRMLAAVDPQCQPRDVGPLGGTDREALDVVAATREELRDARERTGLVLEPHGDRMRRHAATTSPPGASITSTAAAPAGIIGKHFSSASQRTSTTALRPAENAAVSAASSSSSDSTVKPAHPYASASS